LRSITTGTVLAAVAVTAITGALVGRTAGEAIVAVVNGSPISRSAYEEYARVFTAPDGTLGVSEADVLLSLVNQMIVQKESIRQGVAVGDQEVSNVVSDIQHSGHSDIVTVSLPGADAEPEFRERVRMFLLFKLVKANVVGPIEVPVAMLQAEYRRDLSLHVVGLEEAIPVLRERMVRQEADRRWADWLNDQRACAEIRIIDARFSMPSSTPMPECHATGRG